MALLTNPHRDRLSTIARDIEDWYRAACVPCPYRVPRQRLKLPDGVNYARDGTTVKVWIDHRS